jgi:DNA-binding cell septation regulator SpoVG
VRPVAASARPRMRLTDKRPLVKNTFRGFATVELPICLVIHDIPVLSSHGKYWATLPSKAMIDGEGVALRDGAGKIRYRVVNEWSTRDLQNKFSRRVVALVRPRYPNALDPEGTP